jgi:hypothetical protein
LVDRLQQHALGVVEMTSTQVRAAELSLKNVEVALTKAANERGSRAVHATISAEPLSIDEWVREYCVDVVETAQGGLIDPPPSAPSPQPQPG